MGAGLTSLASTGGLTSLALAAGLALLALEVEWNTKQSTRPKRMEHETAHTSQVEWNIKQPTRLKRKQHTRDGDTYTVSGIRNTPHIQSQMEHATAHSQSRIKHGTPHTS